jgi:hypothetical protein
MQAPEVRTDNIAANVVFPDHTASTGTEERWTRSGLAALSR